MAHASEESYEEMISALKDFLSKAAEECGVMESAGNDCVDNTEGDAVAEKSNAKLQKCIKDIRVAFEAIQGVITALKEELEEIRVVVSKANYDE